MYFVNYDKPEQFSDPNKKREIYRYAAYHHRANLQAKKKPENFFPWKRKTKTPSPKLTSANLAPWGLEIESHGESDEQLDPGSSQPNYPEESKVSHRARRVPANEKARKRPSRRRQPASSLEIGQDQLIANIEPPRVDSRVEGRLPAFFDTRVRALTGKPWYVTKAIDYYIQVISSMQSVLQGFSQHPSTDRSNPMSRLFLPLILQDDLVADFMSMYTLCFIVIAHGGKKSPLYPALIHQRNRSIEHIQKRLRAGQFGDMLIQGVNAILSTDALLGNFEHVETHAKGVRALAIARGYESIGSSHPLLAITLRRQLRWVSNMLNMTIDGAPDAPRDTLDPADLLASGDGQLSQDFSELPIGFRSLAVQGMLSAKIIPLLAAFSRWAAAQLDRDPQQLHAAIWHPEVPDGLSAVERCIAMAVCCLSEDKSGGGIHFFYRRSAQHLDRFLADHLTQDEPFTECLIWAMFVLVGGQNPRYLTAEMRYSIIQGARRERDVLQSWPKLEALMKRFYWADECGVRWFQTWKSLSP